jgi:hypothetical protein
MKKTRAGGLVGRVSGDALSSTLLFYHVLHAKIVSSSSPD